MAKRCRTGSRCLGIVALLVLGGVPEANAGKSLHVWADGSFTLGVKNTPVDATSAASWKVFLAQPFADADGEAIVYELSSGDGKARMRVDSCDALFDADADGLTTLESSADGSTPGWDEYRAWATNCYAGRMVSRMSASRTSHVSGFVLDAREVRKLPVAVYPAISSDETAATAKAGAPDELGRLLHGARTRYSKTDQIATIDYPDGSSQDLWVSAKGDFNHDGIQDMLVQSRYQAGAGGSYTASKLYIVTRKSGNGRLITLKTFDPMSGRPPSASGNN